MPNLKTWINNLITDFDNKPAPPGLPLKGEKLILRLFTRADEDLRQSWRKYQDLYLLKYNFPVQGTAENDRTFQRLQDRLRLAVENEQGKMIGYISFKPVARDAAAAELGMCFAADQVSQGYGAETLCLVLPWAYNTLSLERVTLEVDAINERAIRLYRRFGFKKISSRWQKEDNPTLKTFYLRHGFHPGSRCRGQQLELLSWKMERPRDGI